MARIHAKPLLSDDFATYVWKMCEHYNYKPWGMWTCNFNFVVFVSNCETISEVFKSKNTTDKPRMFYKPMARYLGRALFTVNGETYKKQRKRTAVCFRKPVVESLLSTMNKRMAMLISQLSDKADGQDIDIHALVEDHFWVATTSSFISIPVPDHESRLFMEAIRDGMELVQLESVNSLYYWLVHKWRTRRTESNMYEALRIGKKIVPAEKSLYLGPRDEEITASAGQALLKEYTKLEERDADRELFDQALTLIAANHETTSFAVNILLLILALHEDVQQKVYEEIETILGDSERPIETADLARMDYTEMVIKETLRLFPPAPLMARKVKDDTQIGGVVVPKGSIVVVNAMAVQRNPENYPDPLRFDPTRFSPEASEGRHPYAFIPFSSGLRNCPGQLQAYLLIKIFLCYMLRNFKVLRGENLTSVEDIKTRMCVTLRLCEPLLRLSRRRDDTTFEKVECVEPA